MPEQSKRPAPRPAPEAPYWGVTAHEFFAGLRDRSVSVALVDEPGKVYRGVLVGYGQYDLVVRTNAGTMMLIPKHALRYCKPANGDEPAA